MLYVFLLSDQPIERRASQTNQTKKMSNNVCFLVFLSCLGVTSATNLEQTTIVIDGTRQIAEIDDNFVCATLDWWPPEKCNYDQCPWGYASLINLVNIKIINTFQALTTLTLMLVTSSNRKVLVLMFFRTCLLLFLLKPFKLSRR